MVRFTALAEFDVHVAKTQYPRLLIISARARMEGVEECNEWGTEGQVWHEEVYVLGDDGGGVVLYTKLHER